MAPATVRRAPYKDFLQPALHRRFSSAATVLLAVSYLEAILLANWNSFIWSWFPIGPAGIRTFFLFSCGLAIIVLRISQYHVGGRASNSPFQTFTQYFFTIQTLETWLFYAFSSILFCPIFLWSAPKEANLSWITYHKLGDRPRLNERPLLLTCYLLVTAAAQTLVHFYLDSDELAIEVSKSKDGDEVKGSGDAMSSLKTLLAGLPAVLQAALIRGGLVTLITYSVYFLFIRSFAWGWALAFLRLFYNLPKSNMLPPNLPISIFLVVRCFFAGSLLSFIWLTGNYAFSTFMVKEPLKNGRPLTNESKDPNGSLLNGLKSKKLPIRCFALWELAFISKDFEARRKAIFEDIDRKDGPMWSQVYMICLDTINSMEKRMDEYGRPAPAPAVVAQPLIEAKARVSAPLKEDPIFKSNAAPKSMRGEVEKALGQVARAPGQSPVSHLSPIAKKTLRDVRDKVLTKEQQEAMTSTQIKGQLQSLALAVVNAKVIGWYFRQGFRRRIAAVILGTPYIELTQYINAVNVLSLLSVHSLSEDKFGNVHRDVPTIIRTFTIIIRKLEAFKDSFPVHWTDVEKDKDTPEVDAVLGALKTGLAQVVAEFEPYSNDLGLSLRDLRLAKEASSPPKHLTKENDPEMEEVR